MANNSKIEWCDATWNPVRGCTKVSEGCRNCYAETFAERWRGIPGHPFEQGFDLKLVPEKLLEPLKWKKSKRIFVNSMSDLFHKDVPDEYIDKVFAVMALSPHHTFQILTKRPERMKQYVTELELRCRVFGGIRGASAYGIYQLVERWDSNFRGGEFAGILNKAWMDNRDLVDRVGFPLPNVWLGTSVENQKAADERIPMLLMTPASVRYLSCEPLLGPVDLENIKFYTGPDGWLSAFNEGAYPELGKIDWVIAGAESGHGARPMDLNWVRTLRDQTKAAGASFFFKQDAFRGKKIPLPVLDGRTWDEFPEVQS